MAILFSVYTPGKRIAVVSAVESVTGTGVYDEETGRIYVPDYQAIADAMPHYWRKAYARTGCALWFDKAGRLTKERYADTTPHHTLRDRRGVFLATLYATPYHFEGNK